MNNYEFYAVALNNTWLFFGMLAASIVLHYFIFRYQIRSVLDPYFLAVVSSTFCFTDVALLYFTNNISNYIFSSYLFTQLAFFLGLYTFSLKRISFKNNTVENVKYVNNQKLKHVAFYFFSILYLVSQGAVYILKGIPIFMQSRLETFANGGGAGILGRVTDVTSIFSIYLFFCVFKPGKFYVGDLPKYLLLGLIFLTFLLSGSKSNFLVVFNIFWCYIIFARIHNWDYMSYLRIVRKNLKAVLILSLVLVSLIIYIQTSTLPAADDTPGLNPLLALGLRLVHSGDIYWYAYPNNTYLKISSTHWFAALFNDTLGLFRIVPWDRMPQAIGITLKNIHHPSDIIEGPNARHNVFGLIYYGYLGSIIFSYLIGLVLGFVRNKLSYLLNDNILGGFIFVYLMCKISAIDTDPMLTITYLNNLVFIFPVLYFLFLITVEFLKVNPLVHEQ